MCILIDHNACISIIIISRSNLTELLPANVVELAAVMHKRGHLLTAKVQQCLGVFTLLAFNEIYTQHRL